jgi:putative membrane protein
MTPLGHTLGAINATLNATSFVLLLSGFLSIRAKRRDLHRKFMIAAFCMSALFLTTYVVRWTVTGTLNFRGEGPVRWAYFLILFTHVPLAISVVPISMMALYMAQKGRFREHKQITRWLYPIWTYVSVTGVVVYFMLYHLGLPPAHAPVAAAVGAP